MSILTRKDLDGRGCEAPDCDHTHDDGPLAINQRCHPAAPTETWYRAGVVSVTCGTCGATVADIAVAEGPK